MLKKTGAEERKAAEKQRRWDAIVRGDDKSGDEARRLAAHAHLMTHHALEMDTPEAHEAAAMAHDKVSDLHTAAGQACAAAADEDAKAMDKKGKK